MTRPVRAGPCCSPSTCCSAPKGKSAPWRNTRPCFRQPASGTLKRGEPIARWTSYWQSRTGSEDIHKIIKESPIVAQECDTGIQGVGKIAWGSHFCNFYDNQIDLADCLVPFFKAGLDNNEMGFWITSDPLNARDARQLLGKLQPDLADREASGQITILDFTDWYLDRTGSVTAEALRESLERLAAAQQRGLAGVRMSG